MSYKGKLSHLTTDKYACKRCGHRKLFPNESHGHIKGYKCAQCGTVNYPVRDTLNAAD